MVSTLNIEFHSVKESKLSEVDFSNIPFGKVNSDHMFLAEYKNGEWQDFRVVPFGPIPLNPAISALHYGQAIFEGMKAYKAPNGDAILFRPHDHAKRLQKSAERMVMAQVPEELFVEGLKALVSTDKDWVPNLPGTSLYMRPHLFATDTSVGVRPSESYMFSIFACPVGPYYPKPLRVRIETKYARAFPGGVGFAKAAGNYGASLLPAREAMNEGFDQLIWTDGINHEFIEESGTMNIMFMMDGKLVTPALGDTVLSGVTRRSVLQLARDWGMEVEERPIRVAEVVEGIKAGKITEAFGAGTAATIAHIAVINHEGTDLELPPVEQREFSNKVLKALDDIRTGRTDDPYGWAVKV